jgi:hypothetical protein
MTEEDKNNKPLSVPPQVTRLLLLTGIILLLFFTARHFLVPNSFHEYGWYRGNALRENADRPISFAGKKTCVECHEAVVEKMKKSKHNSFSCESCHGPNAKHADDPTVSPTKIENPQFCLQCHEANPSRPTKFPQINPKEHYDGACMDCHQPHQPSETPSK